MKNYIVILLCALFITSLQAQDNGIQFDKNKWESVLAKAKKENKLVFVDAYAVWCGPCKKIAKEVFPQEEVGSFFNKNFVNVKMDMERGEGLALASAYAVTAYPTFLFVNGNGDLVHKGLGYHSKEEFLELGAAAIDPARQLVALTMQYEEGSREELLLKNYTKAKYDAGAKDYGDVALEYLNSIGEGHWHTKENMTFLLSYVSNVYSAPYNYLLANRGQFDDAFTKQVVDRRIAGMIKNEIYRGSGKSISLEDIDELYLNGLPEQSGQLSGKFRMDYYERAGDATKYAEATTTYFEKFPSDNWSELNQYAWSFYENFEDRDLLETALGWAQKSVSIDNNFYNNDTVAALHYKLGNKKEAKKAAKLAIKQAKAGGESFEETADLLRRIKAM